VTGIETMSTAVPSPGAELDLTKVPEIRRPRASGLSYSKLESRFGISRQWAIAIVKGRAWQETNTPRGAP
jgi:hypothetical protein